MSTVGGRDMTLLDRSDAAAVVQLHHSYLGTWSTNPSCLCHFVKGDIPYLGLEVQMWGIICFEHSLFPIHLSHYKKLLDLGLCLKLSDSVFAKRALTYLKWHFLYALNLDNNMTLF